MGLSSSSTISFMAVSESPRYEFIKMVSWHDVAIGSPSSSSDVMASFEAKR